MLLRSCFESEYCSGDPPTLHPTTILSSCLDQGAPFNGQAIPSHINMRKCRVLPGGRGVTADIQLSIQSNFPLSVSLHPESIMFTQPFLICIVTQHFALNPPPPRSSVAPLFQFVLICHYLPFLLDPS